MYRKYNVIFFPIVTLQCKCTETYIEIVLTLFSGFLFDRIRRQVGIDSWLVVYFAGSFQFCDIVFSYGKTNTWSVHLKLHLQRGKRSLRERLSEGLFDLFLC